MGLTLIGCGGSSSSSGPSPATPFSLQSGNWNVNASSSAAPGNNFIVGGNLTQSGTNISGVMHIFSSACFDLTIDVPVTGSVSAQSVTLTSSAIAGQVVTVNASGTSATALTGTYSVGGTGCAAGDKGTISANLVPSISGSWHGTFTSSVAAGTTINATATLTQSSTPDADGLFPVTGTVTFTGSPCFASGTIRQSIFAGGVLGLDLTTNDTPTPGEVIVSVVMDSPSTATAATGIIQIDAGSCNGDIGTGHITKP